MQAKGRLQCWNADGAGKGQAATLEQQRLTARGLGAVPHLRWRVLGVLGVLGVLSV